MRESNAELSIPVSSVMQHGQVIDVQHQRDPLSFSSERSYEEMKADIPSSLYANNKPITNHVARIERIVLSERPAFNSDTFPIRIDVESAGVDVIWREARDHSRRNIYEKIDKERNILRRERFQFDEIFAGVGAPFKLYVVLRDRVKRSISLNRSLTFVVLSCGETFDDSLSTVVEPPLALLLGDKGGSGILSTVVDELFYLLLPPLSHTTKNASIHADTLNSQHVKITLSAVVLYPHGEVLDLLGDFTTTTTNKPCKLSKRSNGNPMFTNLTTVKLDKSSDLDRIVGVLLGKKSCRHEFESFISKFGEKISNVDENFSSSSSSISSLLNCTEATLFVSVKVASLSSRKKSPTLFHFVCPYGKKWATPSENLSLFAEVLACYPNPPPPSLVRASVLSQLLLDPVVPTDFMCIANISKSNKDKDVQTNSVSRHPSPFCSAISTNSFRHVQQSQLATETTSKKPSEDTIQANFVKRALTVLRLVSHLPHHS